jgi:hypothetical protein
VPRTRLRGRHLPDLVTKLKAVHHPISAYQSGVSHFASDTVLLKDSFRSDILKGEETNTPDWHPLSGPVGPHQIPHRPKWHSHLLRLLQISHLNSVSLKTLFRVFSLHRSLKLKYLILGTSRLSPSFPRLNRRPYNPKSQCPFHTLPPSLRPP